MITINAKKYRKVEGMAGKTNSREYENTFLRPSSTAALTKMFTDCKNAMKQFLWRGDTYQGPGFVELNPDRDGIF